MNAGSRLSSCHDILYLVNFLPDTVFLILSKLTRTGELMQELRIDYISKVG